MQMQVKLAPRTKLTLTFNEHKTYQMVCYKNGTVYSQREVVVIGDDEDLESVYADWFDEHLAEILLLRMPSFGILRVYRHGIAPPAWISSMTGKTDEGILYRNQRDRFMYIRSAYVHEHNTSGNYFYGVQPRVTACWSAADSAFRQVWNKYFWRWFDRNYIKTWKMTKIQNFWSKLVFMAGKALGFDLGTLSTTNFLPGVETLGDLILTANMGCYGLSEEELKTKIF